MAEASALTEEAHRFWLARTALRGYLTARSELDWRVRNMYNKTDAFTKAVEGLGGVGDFQSCADECAYSVARARGGDSFACLGLVPRVASSLAATHLAGRLCRSRGLKFRDPRLELKDATDERRRRFVVTIGGRTRVRIVVGP